MIRREFWGCLGMAVAMSLLLREEFVLNANRVWFRIEQSGASAGATQQVRVNERMSIVADCRHQYQGRSRTCTGRGHQNFQR